jgi:hypothetical protein
VNSTEAKPSTSALNALEFEITHFVTKHKHSANNLQRMAKKQPMNESKQQLAWPHKMGRKTDDPVQYKRFL